MSLESATYLSQLVATNPPNTDLISQADDHVRLIKGVLQNQFPNFTAAALTSTQAQIDALTAGSAQTPGTFTGTLTGMTGATSGTVKYILSAGLCTLFLDADLTGTSNTTALTMTGVPSAAQPSAQRVGLCMQTQDASVGGGVGVYSITAGTITFYKGVAAGAWTASGTKGLNAAWYVTYPL
jgi:hypothetical protein